MTATTTAPGRPRSAAADQAIRDATIALLGGVGYESMTMAGVAAAAGVSTATLYRRWRSKLDLVVAVLQARAEERTFPDTGSLAGDCRAVLRAMVETLSTPSGAILAAVVGESRRNPELADAFRRALVAPRRAQYAQMLDRAAARRELRAGLDYDLVADLFSGAIYSRLLVTGRPLTRKVADQLAELVVRAIAADPPRRRERRTR